MENAPQKQNATINISTSTILKVVFILLMIGFLFLIRGVLAVVFIALILASAFDSSVDWLQKRKIPRSIGLLIIFAMILGLISLAFILLITPLKEQWDELLSGISNKTGWLYTNTQAIWQYLSQHNLLDQLQQFISQGKLNSALSEIFGKIGDAASGLFTLIFVLVLTFYITVEETAIKKLIWAVTPSEYQPYIMQLVNRVQKQIGSWLKAVLFLGLIVGLMTMVGLYFIGNKYYLVLGLFAGIFEIIPIIGPIFAGIVATLLTLATYGWGKALIVAILAIVIQQLENNLLVPKVMQKAVGLNPIISLVALLIGAKLGGVVGALMAIPVTTAIMVITKDFIKVDEKVEEAK